MSGTCIIKTPGQTQDWVKNVSGAEGGIRHQIGCSEEREFG